MQLWNKCSFIRLGVTHWLKSYILDTCFYITIASLAMQRWVYYTSFLWVPSPSSVYCFLVSSYLCFNWHLFRKSPVTFWWTYPIHQVTWIFGAFNPLIQLVFIYHPPCVSVRHWCDTVLGTDVKKKRKDPPLQKPTKQTNKNPPRKIPKHTPRHTWETKDKNKNQIKPNDKLNNRLNYKTNLVPDLKYSII